MKGGVVEVASEGAQPVRRRWWLIVGLLVAVLALTALAGALAWRQYTGARHRAINEQRSRAVLAASVLDTWMSGQISTLNAVATAPSVTRLDHRRMVAFFDLFQRRNAKLFTGGLGWIDAHGVQQVTSNPAAANLHPSVSDRSFFKQVMKTGKPYVSEGLVGRITHQRVIVVAVPTRDAGGAVTGVLAGGIDIVPSASPSRASIDLGYTGLDILDRNGVSLLAGFRRPANTALVDRLKRTGGNGAVTGQGGLGSTGDHVVAYATAAVPSWTIVIDRPASAVLASARHQLELEAALVATVAALVLALLAALGIRARRDRDRQAERTRQGEQLTTLLAAAATPHDVADSLCTVLSAAVPSARCVVAWRRPDSDDFDVSTAGRVLWSPGRQRDRMAAVVMALVEAGRPVPLPTRRDVSTRLAPARDLAGARAAHVVPMLTATGDALGAAVLLLPREGRLRPHQAALVAAHCQQAASALERAHRYEWEHDVAVRLQRGLLPERLPSVPGLDLAARYQAGTAALEIGGDWYDVVRRSDGLVVMIVGDVAGRGLGAAMVMGELRTAFRAYAFDHSSPAAVIRHLARHVPEDEMVTAICLTLDPYTGDATFTSAGHPPAVLSQRSELGRRIGLARTPPLGFADPATITEERCAVERHTAIALFTDGLVEQRGRAIDAGIDRVAATVGGHVWVRADDIGDALLAGVADEERRDDIALLVVRILDAPDVFDIEMRADPDGLSQFRARLRAWLEQRGVDAADRGDAVLAASEACNNAIEHGYGAREGDIRIQVAHHANRLEISITDRGTWREPVDDPFRGRGVSIMETVAEDVVVRSGTSGTVVVLSMELGAGV
jgi:serine phosphatase RsbU (regulator of sigma subunit)/anti-sigma regulatory factor (Ser/Thr protein kinase)